jgi:murein DD-endopeptidase MepM/ murein hydrolase activator NlpD
VIFLIIFNFRKKNILIFLIAVFSTVILILTVLSKNNHKVGAQKEKKFIKYAEFTPTFEALEYTMNIDIKTHENKNHISWIDTLAYLSSRYGGDFEKYRNSHVEDFVKRINDGEKIEDLTKNLKFFFYYKEVYSAVLGNFLGEYRIEKPEKEAKQEYGLKVFSPIAKTFPFCHYPDFGALRKYGYSRPHLGHDLMCAVGTPVISVESGTVEAMGWNRYGGWRLGIRSDDKKRYYYYAHLRQNRPYHSEISEGSKVQAGDVIGYVGRTGYSTKENMNNISQSHLHLGMELIFDESQKDSNNEIWIDLYSITKLLQKNKSAVRRENSTKEFFKNYKFEELSTGQS